MEQKVEKKICHQLGCKILEGGSCLEGIDVTKNDCPHFYVDDANEDMHENEISNESQKKHVINLFTGKEMSFPETSIITNSKDCRLIVVVGESESGKTTLLAEYFINFQKGPFCDYLFSGSLTQIGFEERCYKAAVESGNKYPKTERTKSKEFNFLHLSLKHKDEILYPSHHFLFSDISGERFRDAKTSAILMRELSILKAADFVVFLIDGEKIANLNNRALAIEDAKTFIQKALDEQIFDLKTNLKIALAKWDFLCNDSSFSFEGKIIKPFSDRFSTRLKKLEFTKIAARPKTNSIPPAMGLGELLTEWDKTDIRIPTNGYEKPVDSDRAFHHFTSPKT
jgi:hypothetical protein